MYLYFNINLSIKDIEHKELDMVKKQRYTVCRRKKRIANIRHFARDCIFSRICNE